MYQDILTQDLLPFLREVYPNGHHFAQDNDPKHTSHAAQQYYATNNINWWRTPPESPDINPIELVWHELKEYLRREVKPYTKNELVRGIQTFWDTVTVEKCRKHIGHLRKVIPCITEFVEFALRLLGTFFSCEERARSNYCTKLRDGTYRTLKSDVSQYHTMYVKKSIIHISISCRTGREYM